MKTTLTVLAIMFLFVTAGCIDSPKTNQPEAAITIAGHNAQEIVKLLGAKLDGGVTHQKLDSYNRIFGFGDTNKDGQHSKAEYIDGGRYMTPQTRAMIFKAADSNKDEVVTRKEYIINRIITDEAKEIMAGFDSDKNGSISKDEFVNNCPIKDKNLVAIVFAELDINNDDQTVIPEYLRIWGKWARSGKNNWQLE
ncbi:MAG: hypothetical protein GY845_05545 [Planctomycetes bacterium]|nr:hypothetical protein [Planctomycetota bacterium]